MSQKTDRQNSIAESLPRNILDLVQRWMIQTIRLPLHQLDISLPEIVGYPLGSAFADINVHHGLAGKRSEPHNYILDGLLLLEDGTLLDVEFQSTNKPDDWKRFNIYVMQASMAYDKDVRCLVLYGGHVKPQPKRGRVTRSHISGTFEFQSVILADKDAEDAFQQLKDAAERGTLSEEEKAWFVLLPLMHIGENYADWILKVFDFGRKTRLDETCLAAMMLLAQYMAPDDDAEEKIGGAWAMSSIAEELKSISLVDAEKMGEKNAEKRVKENIARNMLRDGEPVERVIRYTGLSQEEVQRLAAEIQAEETQSNK